MMTHCNSYGLCMVYLYFGFLLSFICPFPSPSSLPCHSVSADICIVPLLSLLFFCAHVFAYYSFYSILRISISSYCTVVVVFSVNSYDFKPYSEFLRVAQPSFCYLPVTESALVLQQLRSAIFGRAAEVRFRTEVRTRTFTNRTEVRFKTWHFCRTEP